MVGTDLLARGIDTCNTNHVIEFDFCNDAVKYIHRAGRTGRMGSFGRVTTFVRGEESELAQEIMKRQKAGERLDDVFSRKGSFRTKRKRN